jgi:tRNA(Ile)-lysidine synthase
MLKHLKEHIDTDLAFIKGKRLLLACSGGLDSVVMTQLFKALNFDIGLAHCNFLLRGAESDEDEAFVSALAEQLEVPVYIENFDTKQFAEDHKISIQMAARELRYNWFEEICNDFNYHFILTAHHADDNLETMLINLSRGTGIRGLTGIKAVNGNIIRPLLPFSRTELLSFAKKKNFYWREDSSNAGNDYLRNELRHQVIPPFKKAVPGLLDNVQSTQKHLAETAGLLEDYMSLVYQLAVSEMEFGYSIDILKLSELPNTNALLYELLHPFGFSAWEDISRLLAAQSGKQIFSDSHRLLKDRSALLLTEIPKEDTTNEVLISETTKKISQPVALRFEDVKAVGDLLKTAIYIDKDQLHFPLEIRKWREGDAFHPFGMAGKKKLSKFFKDEKLSLVAKENIHVLCSNNQVVWVIGYRMDDNFKVQPHTKNIIKISIDT